ncbi:MAG: peptidase [Anaerolineae bacterium]|nr:peptidase [Anaerolineae bacterium]
MARRHRSQAKKKTNKKEKREENLAQGRRMVWQHPMFWQLNCYVYTREKYPNPCPRNGLIVVSDQGGLYANPNTEATPTEWAYAIAHGLLHLGMGHFEERENQLAWNVACDLIIGRFLAELKFGKQPLGLPAPNIGAGQTEETLYERFCRDGIPEHYLGYTTAVEGQPDMIWEKKSSDWDDDEPDWPRLFGLGLKQAVFAAIDVAGGQIESLADGRYYNSDRNSSGKEAKNWVINHLPLLGALASSFEVVEDQRVCQQMSISVAAVDAHLQTIYINPAAGLDEEQFRFVMAHELLHVGLCHQPRQEGRDPYLWNVACDYVINGWLIEMGIGEMPPLGGLLDSDLKGLSAEAIYDRIVGDMRRMSRLATLRGKGLGDMMGPSDEWWKSRDGVALDDFYRRCLGQGLVYQEEHGRGYLPAGLIEEIRALSQPPIPWDVELARWFDAMFAPLEKVRSYARLSRRQSSTPDIPRPRWVTRPEDEDGRTFGVVLDTSGSMDQKLLAKALGTIASYSIAHEVPAVRVVFCDAAAYDQGYMPPEDIAGRVRVRGRGGTILQPGVDLLEKSDDFPGDGPILVITDGECDRIRIRHEHAFLIPDGCRLPFPARGPVFKMS